MRTAGDKKQAVIVQEADHGRNGELQMRECAGARGSCAGRTSSIWLQGQLQTQPSMGNRYLLQHQLECSAAAAKTLRPAAQSGDVRAKYSPILERGTKTVIMQKLLQCLLHFRRRGVATGQALAYTVEAQDVKQHGPKGGAQHVERLGKYGGKAVAFKKGGGVKEMQLCTARMSKRLRGVIYLPIPRPHLPPLAPTQKSPYWLCSRGCAGS